MRCLKPISSCIAALALAALPGCRTPVSDGLSGNVLLEADAAFAQAAARDGVAQAFHDYAAPDATIFPQGANPITGQDEILKLMLQNRGQLTWTPRGADISRDGVLGYTWGVYQFREAATNALETAAGWKMEICGRYW
jgi:hypothetical protein